MKRSRPVDDEDDEEGGYSDHEIPTVPCPYCKADILEDAERCPRCENYISAEDAPSANKPAWIWLLLIVATLLMILAAFQ